MAAENIIDACEREDVDEVERLLPRVRNPAGVRSDWWWTEGATLLHYSCRHGWLDVTRRLLEQYHCDPESRDKDGDTPLHKACREGHVDIVRYLISERGCSTACHNMNGDIPLLEACENGRLTVVEILLTAQDCSTACNKHSRILLHYSCYHGWLDVTRRLVEQYHCDPESSNWNGDTLLHEACCKGCVEIVRFLVNERGCSTVYQSKDGNTPLLEACRNGHLAVVEILLTAQDCSTACKKHGEILLHYSCHHGWLDVTRRLVEQYHCDPESSDKDGDTPLHVACRQGHVDIVRYLVSEQGCSTVHQNKDGNIPLLEACEKGRLAVVEILLTAQDCSTACDKRNRILLHYSCHHGWLDVTRRLVEQYHCDPESRNWNGDTLLHEACREGHVDIVRFLVSERGCSTACQNKYRKTPLLEACEDGHLAVVEILLTTQDCSTACKEHSRILLHYSCHHRWQDVTRRLVEQYHCDPECRNEDGDTLLHEACRKGHVDIVKYLVCEQGFSTACQNKRGNTPLHEACCQNNLEMVKFLVSEQGCNTACQNKRANTPLLEACKTGRLAVVEILLTAQDCSIACNKDSRILLHYSCYHGWLDVTRRLVEQYHCDPEGRDLNGDTLLHEACRKGHVDIGKYLISERRCSTACENKDGNTPFLEACRNNRCLSVVELLLTGYDCSTACKKHGEILLHYSCRYGWLDVTRRLLEQYHCNPESRDKDGDTPLHVACCEGHVDIVRYLVSERGCSTACQNKNGDTPLHVACCEGHVDIVRYLVSERGCSTACQNKNGDTPLHVSCMYNRMGVVRFLLSSGRVDPWCRNARNQTPLQCSRNYVIAKLCTNFTGLSSDTIQTAIKIFVFGNPAAGKSTLVKVIENKVTSRFGTFAGQFRNVSGVEMKTAGINTVTIQSNTLGTVTVYDLAGHFEYYSSHDALVGNLMSSSAAVFIVVVKLSESEAEVIRTLQYWISFIENCCSRVKATAHLIVIGSWADRVKEAGENVDQKWLDIKKACISSSSSLSFVGFAALDCRKLASSGLDKICDMIESSCTALREAKVLEQGEIVYPHLLHTFISTKLHTQVAFSIRGLCAHITAEDDALLPTEPSLLSPLLSSLSDGGHLLYLPNKEDFEAGWVIMDKQALLSKINGTIFAPNHFKQHHDIATSTGVVPKSKVASVFAEKYSIDMILSVLTLFEFCHKINDSFTLSLIADNDPSRDSATAIATGDESSESYYFFPALVRVEHPTDVWQSSGPGHYQCGWCLQCSKEGQYLTPWFLHVLLLRLAFSFAPTPDIFQQDKTSPVLRRRCAIWKNGIQWLDQDGVETIVEVSEQNRVVLLLMSCLKGKEMACVRLRSSLISKVLETRAELCPGISTTELLIDPSNLSSYPLPSSSELTLYRVADQVVKAVKTVPAKDFILDTTGRKTVELEKALHFEPYHGMHVRRIDQLFDEDLAIQEVDDSFLHDLAADLHTKLMEQISTQAALQMFGVLNARQFYSYCEQFPDERYNPIMRCFRLFLTWKTCDTNGATYWSLRTTLDECSIFCGRNPISMVVDAGSSEAGGISTGVENKSTQ